MDSLMPENGNHVSMKELALFEDQGIFFANTIWNQSFGLWKKEYSE
jgi:hypothetical protein